MPVTQRPMDGEALAQMQQQLAVEMRTTTVALQGLMSELHQNSQAVAILRTEFLTVKDNVDSLSRAIRDGFSGGVFGRLALLEKSVEKIGEWTEDQTKQQQQFTRDVLKDKKDREDSERSQHLKVVLAVVTGVFGLLASIVAGVLAVLSHTTGRGP